MCHNLLHRAAAGGFLILEFYHNIAGLLLARLGALPSEILLIDESRSRIPETLTFPTSPLTRIDVSTCPHLEGTSER